MHALCRKRSRHYFRRLKRRRCLFLACSFMDAFSEAFAYPPSERTRHGWYHPCHQREVLDHLLILLRQRRRLDGNLPLWGVPDFKSEIECPIAPPGDNRESIWSKDDVFIVEEITKEMRDISSQFFVFQSQFLFCKCVPPIWRQDIVHRSVVAAAYQNFFI